LNSDGLTWFAKVTFANCAKYSEHVNMKLTVKQPCTTQEMYLALLRKFACR